MVYESMPWRQLICLLDDTCDSYSDTDIGIARTFADKTIDDGFWALVDSMLTYGQRAPVAIFDRGGKVILGNGHHRVAAAVYLNMPVLVHRSHRYWPSESCESGDKHSGYGCQNLGEGSSREYASVVMERVLAARRLRVLDVIGT